MQSEVKSDDECRPPNRIGISETELERRGLKLELGVPVTGATTLGDAVVVGFGDGTIRLFRPGHDPVIHQAHLGVVLCMAAYQDFLVTGGDDGRFLRMTPDGLIEELDDFDTKWVDCVAASDGLVACSSGKNVRLWMAGQSKPLNFIHPSTVGGLSFDAKGRRLAVAHYGAVTLWERTKRKWKSSTFAWKGFHGAVTFSPDGKYLVTAMQENALHGWRIRDKANLAMSGYPAKVKSFAWTGNTPFLATSGADEIICWPFDGKFGPMERSPLCVGHNRKQIATYVRSLSDEEAVFAGFRDGSVLLAKLDETTESIAIRGSNGAEVTAIEVSPSKSHVLIGDALGNVLWAPLMSGAEYARNV